MEIADDETCCSENSSTSCESTVLCLHPKALAEFSNAQAEASTCALETLDELDRILDLPPMPQPSISCSSIAEAYSAQKPIRKQRSLEEVVQRLPLDKPSYATMFQLLDVAEMRMVLNACGEPSSGLTKARCAERLLALCASGALTSLKRRLCGATAPAPSCGVARIQHQQGATTSNKHPCPTPQAAKSKAVLMLDSAPSAWVTVNDGKMYPVVISIHQ
jgi:hypothetical protein